MISSDYQAKFAVHELERVYANDDVAKLSGLMFDAQIIGECNAVSSYDELFKVI